MLQRKAIRHPFRHHQKANFSQQPQKRLLDREILGPRQAQPRQISHDRRPCKPRKRHPDKPAHGQNQ